MSGVFISRVRIENFRNFKSVDIRTGEKQVLFGENESGKSNYLFALQLILDPTFSDQDRQLALSDFNDTIQDPAITREQILVSIDIDGFVTSRTLLAQLSDALVSVDGKEFIRITYKYYPNELEDGTLEYLFSIYKGDREDVPFGPRDRRYLQLKVIKPLRDVDHELRNSRSSPLTRLLEGYEIEPETLATIATSMETQSANLLNLDELTNLQTLIENRLSRFLSRPVDTEVAFTMAEIEPARIISAIRVLISGKALEENSLGLKNVLYMALLLLQFYPGRIPSLVKARDFVRLSDNDSDGVLARNYARSGNGNYILNPASTEFSLLQTFFEQNQPIGVPEVIVAIEEPEAHLHPMLQRLVFRDVVSTGSNSVILTTHSPHITSITPMEYMVHLLKVSDNESIANSAVALHLDAQDKLDIKRYLDVSRGEIYFGRKVILVEGIAEQHLVPRFAELMGVPLDRHGVVVCNINSTNFAPYTRYMRMLSIPHVVLTDGDYFLVTADGDRLFHKVKPAAPVPGEGLLGAELAKAHLQEMRVTVPSGATFEDLRVLAGTVNWFFGVQTLEIDMMQASLRSPQATSTVVVAYEKVCMGGDRQRSNFRSQLGTGEFDKCLSKIEDVGVGKGRFAQSMASLCVVENIPEYVRNAIRRVIEM